MTTLIDALVRSGIFVSGAQDIKNEISALILLGGGGGGSSTATTVSFTSALPLDTVDAGKKFAESTLNAPVTFSVAGGAVEEGNLSFSLIGNGDVTAFPTFPSPFVTAGGAYKTTAGQQNIYGIVYTNGTPMVFRNDGRLILVPPGATTGLGATMGSTTAALAWTAPASGGAPSDYLIEYKTNASGTWLTWPHTPSVTVSATITGLASSTLYNFRVSALNTGGTGATSTTNGTTNAAATSIAADTFTGTTGNSINGRTTTSGSLVWSGDDLQINGNQARSPVGDWGSVRLNVGVTTYTVSIDVASYGDSTSAAGAVGVVFRASSTRDEQIVALAMDANTISVYKCSLIAYGDYFFHFLGGSTGSGIGSHISVDVTPTTYTVRGSTGVVAYSATDSFNAAQTRCGIHMGNVSGQSTSRLDNFLVTT